MTEQVETAVELLPCPLCGDKAKVIKARDGIWQVECDGNPTCYLFLTCRPTEKDAIAAWNVRA